MYSIADLILQALSWIVQILIFAIIIRAILSWFPIGRDNAFVQALDRISEPVIAPLRRVVPPLGMIDITPLVALILLQLVLRIISGLCFNCRPLLGF